MLTTTRFLPACLLAAGLSFPARAPAAWADRIEPWVTAHTAGTDSAEFIVVLRDRADLTPAERLGDRAARGRFVRDALFAKARDTQEPLLQWLRERKIQCQSFFIVNAVLVRGDRRIVDAIAIRPEVDHIEGNPEIRVLDSAEAPGETAEPQQAFAVEPGVSAIRAPEMWAAGFTGQGIVIGSADSGVQWNHPALINHYRGWNGSAAQHDYNWHDSVHSGGGSCGPDSPVPCDDDDHGTHTTGIAVGSDGGANQIGVAPGAKFIACRNMDQGTGTLARYLECMEWFLAPYPVGGTSAQGDPSKAPDITVNSWGCSLAEGCSPRTLQAAVEAQRAAGILFVTAAGNLGSGCSTVEDPPAIYEASYTVGAFNTTNGAIASFSSRGPVTADSSNRIKPDIMAPGVNVRSSVRGGLYATASGTSASAPHVAGAAALLWSAYPSLRNSILQTEGLLDEGADHVSVSTCGSSGVPNDAFGWGRLDVKAAYDLGTAGVDLPPTRASSGVWLRPPFPNPAHRSMLLHYHVDRDGVVRLAVFAVGGRRVRTLEQRYVGIGDHQVRWEGRDDRGSTLAPGLYFARLESAARTAIQRLIWLGP